jgi:dUTP diphosphatase
MNHLDQRWFSSAFKEALKSLGVAFEEPQVTLNYVLLDTNNKPPVQKNDEDMGIDLFASDTRELWPGKRCQVPLGFKASLPFGYGALLWDRSGLAAKQGLHLLGGVIDCGYRDEWQAIVINLSDEFVMIRKGDKICQAIIQKKVNTALCHVEKLEASVRGANGFGSSGVR